MPVSADGGGPAGLTALVDPEGGPPGLAAPVCPDGGFPGLAALADPAGEGACFAADIDPEGEPAGFGAGASPGGATFFFARRSFRGFAPGMIAIVFASLSSSSLACGAGFAAGVGAGTLIGGAGRIEPKGEVAAGGAPGFLCSGGAAGWRPTTVARFAVIGRI